MLALERADEDGRRGALVDLGLGLREEDANASLKRSGVGGETAVIVGLTPDVT